MANHGVDLGVKSQQQIAAVASIMGGAAGALLLYEAGENFFIGLGIGAAISFVLALINRWVGLLICLIGALIIFEHFSNA